MKLLGYSFLQVFIGVLLLYFNSAGLYREMGSMSALFSHISDPVFLLGCPREAPGAPHLTGVVWLLLVSAMLARFSLVTPGPFNMQIQVSFIFFLTKTIKLFYLLLIMASLWDYEFSPASSVSLNQTRSRQAAALLAAPPWS